MLPLLLVLLLLLLLLLLLPLTLLNESQFKRNAARCFPNVRCTPCFPVR